MRKSRLTALFLCVTMACAMVLPACGSSAKGPKQLAVCVGPEPDTIDPALNSSVDGATLVIHAFEGLMTLDSTGTPVLGQAKEYKVSDDNLTYTFTLRDDLQWSDGTKITSEDFIYSWNRAIDPKTAADYEYMFDAIEGYADGKLNVTAPDEKTLVVKLAAVTPYFLELTAFPAYSPVQKATVEANGEKWATDPSTYVTNGAYTLTEWVHSSYMIYTKNDKYWNKDAVKSETIKFVLMDDDNAQLSAFQNGELSMIDSMPTDELETLSTQPTFHKEGQLGTYYISFNTQDEVLKNPLVRKALILAIDRTYICEKIGKSGQEEAGAFVPIGLSDADAKKEFREVGGDYYDPKDYTGNLEKAKAALAEAGYPNGEGLPTIEYLYNTGSGNQLIGEALQDMWSKIGVKVSLASQEWATFLNTRKSGGYDIARNGWLGDYNDPISFLDMWTTGGGNNVAQWSNTKYDALIEKIKGSSDQTERMKLMHEAEDMIFDDWMLCPIYYYVDTFLLAENVEGFFSSPLGFKYFMYATIK